MKPGGIVVVTSANAATARMLIPRLRERGWHVIGLLRHPADVGADETIADWTHAAAAKEAFGRADVILHLSGDANARNRAAYRAANYLTTKLVAENVAREKQQRIIYLSYANASVTERNHYLHYKGAAEKLLLSTGKEVVIFRCPVILDAPGAVSRIDELFIAKKGRAVPVIGDGRQKMRPVYRGDVVEAILAAMQRGRMGIYALSGPEEITVNELVRLANRDPRVRMRHIPGWLAFLLSRVVPGLSATFVDLLLRHSNSVYDPGAYREFGVKATPVSRLYEQLG